MHIEFVISTGEMERTYMCTMEVEHMYVVCMLWPDNRQLEEGWREWEVADRMFYTLHFTPPEYDIVHFGDAVVLTSTEKEAWEQVFANPRTDRVEHEPLHPPALRPSNW